MNFFVLKKSHIVFKVRGHLVADLDPLQIKFGNGTLFYNRHGQPDESVVRDYLIQIESKTLIQNLYTNMLYLFGKICFRISFPSKTYVENKPSKTIRKHIFIHKLYSLIFYTGVRMGKE